MTRYCIAILCALAACAGARAETFVIHEDTPGHEATVRIPVGAITQLSADFAESLVGYADPQFESMRLRGDVSISIAGSSQPIQIKANSLVLELTPDASQGRTRSAGAEAEEARRPISVEKLAGGGDSQVFVGNVVFDLQTSSGPMQIKADRIEHRTAKSDPVAKPGA